MVQYILFIYPSVWNLIVDVVGIQQHSTPVFSPVFSVWGYVKSRLEGCKRSFARFQSIFHRKKLKLRGCIREFGDNTTHKGVWRNHCFRPHKGTRWNHREILLSIILGSEGNFLNSFQFCIETIQVHFSWVGNSYLVNHLIYCVQVSLNIWTEYSLDFLHSKTWRLYRNFNSKYLPSWYPQSSTDCSLISVKIFDSGR